MPSIHIESNAYCINSWQFQLNHSFNKTHQKQTQLIDAADTDTHAAATTASAADDDDADADASQAFPNIRQIRQTSN